MFLAGVSLVDDVGTSGEEGMTVVDGQVSVAGNGVVGNVVVPGAEMGTRLEAASIAVATASMRGEEVCGVGKA